MFDHDRIQPAYDGDSKRARVEQMFDRIAPRYDRLNQVMSLGIDKSWRRALIREVMRIQPHHVLDVATGTADLAIALAKAGVQDVTGVDISQEMLAIGAQKAALAEANIHLKRADSEDLPFETGAFDAVTAAFGVRNFEHLEKGVTELVRVLRPGGVLAILELSTPTSPVLRALHGVYTRNVLPRVGALVSGERAAYEYLPASVAAFPCGQDFVDVITACGGADARCLPLTFGIASLYVASARAAAS